MKLKNINKTYMNALIPEKEGSTLITSTFSQKNLSKIVLLIIILGLCPQFLIASKFNAFESSINDTSGVELSDMLTKIRLEQEFDYKIREQLSTFLETNRFMVNSTVEIKLIQNNDNNDNGIIKNTESKENQELPGIPSLPSFLLLNGVSDKLMMKENPQEFTSYVYVQSISVQLLIDEDYSPSDLDFIKRIVENTLKMKPSRGDLVQINQVAFPKKVNQIISISDSLNNITVSLDESSTSTTLPTLKFPIWWLVAAVILSGIMVFLYFIYKKFDAIQSEVQSNTATVSGSERSQQISGNLVKKAEINDIDNKELQRTEKDPVRLFVTMVKNNPSDLGRFLEHEFTNKNVNVLKTLVTVDKKLVFALEPYISPKIFKLMSSWLFANESNYYEIDSVQSLLDQVSERKNPNGIVYKFTPNQCFNFIHLMTNYELLMLMDNLSSEETVILLGHLDVFRFNDIMEQMDDKKIAEIWKVFDTAHYILLKEYEEAAQKIFSKSGKLLNTPKLTKTQLEGLVEALENTVGSKKDAMLNSLREISSDFSKSMLKHILRIEDLFTATDQVIEEILSDLSTKSIATVCTLVDEARSEMIMNSRAEREKIYIKSLIKKGFSNDEIRQAEFEVITKMKQSLYFKPNYEN